MSHMASLRSASLRALRSGSTVAAVSRCTTNAHRLGEFEQRASYSALPTSPQRTLMTDNNNSTFRKRTISERAIPIDSFHADAYAISRCLHTSPILFESVNVTTPPFPESVKEGTIRFIKKVGDKVAVDETIAEIETDKASLQVNAAKAGVIEQYLVADGDNVTSGAQIAKLNTSGDFKPSVDQQIKTPPAAATQAKPEQSKQSPPKSPATPVTSFDLSPHTGSERDTSGPQRAHPHLPPPPTQFTGYDPSKVSVADPKKITGTRSETRVKMSRMRLKIAERLKGAQNTCAMLTTFNEIDMSNLMEFRKKYADQFQKRHNIKLGFMSAFVKAAACALVDNPIVNAVIDGNDIVYRDYVDISVAVAAPKGLVVPVLRNVEKMNFADIERTINEYGQKAKTGTLAIEDMDGGTFTISNGGVFGSLFGTPIINLPQSAILGMHGIFDRPVAVNGKVEIHPMMYVALTYDHRILDGRDAVLFLRKIKQYVEDSRSIFLDL